MLAGEDGTMLGRSNLFELEDGTARLGYRVTQHVASRSLMTATGQELCRRAPAKYGLRTLRTATGRQNVASQRVLAKARFVAAGPADLGGKPPGTSAHCPPVDSG
jgi:[ribosomal protein S5]-alanine N-acetyltransferase